jgi:hypothetical protein
MYETEDELIRAYLYLESQEMQIVMTLYKIDKNVKWAEELKKNEVRGDLIESESARESSSSYLRTIAMYYNIKKKKAELKSLQMRREKKQ